MRINTLRLKNFKCFEDLEVNFDPHMNIVVGINGSGKTALLEGLSVALGGFFGGLEEVDNRTIKDKEIRLKLIHDNPEYQLPTIAFADCIVFDQKYNWSVSRVSLSKVAKINGNEIYSQSKIAQNKVRSGEPVNLPLLVWYRTNRLFKEPTSESSKSIEAKGRFKGYINALNGLYGSLTLTDWIKESEYDEYQKQRHIDPHFEDIGMKLLEQTLTSFLPIFVSFYYSLKQNSVILVKANGDGHSVPTLNDGYKNIFRLVADLVHRCTQLNPHLGEKALIETDGVVLIDEVDLHLYPGLQRTILPLLKDTFPKIQWVITTHSPLVISSTKSKLIVLDNYAVKEESSYYGKNVEYVLEALMDVPVRPNNVQTLLNEYRAYIERAQSKSPEAEKLRKEIENLIGDDDPEYLAIKDLISFFE